MAMYNFNISSFADAERLYNNTKPIRGKKMVPLGDRRRKHERIVKVSPKCYVLLNEMHEEKYSSYNWYKTEEDLIAEAAVTWTLTDNNNSVVEFRNGDGDYSHVSRYSFLERCMPSSMRFVVDSGKQYVSHKGDRHYLPKDKDKTVVFTDRHTPQEAWALTSKPHPKPVTRTRVLKEEKDPFKDDISDFLHWAWDMTPILDSGRVYDWMENHKARQKVSAYTGNSRDCMVSFRQAISNSEHEDRVDLLVHFLIGYQEKVRERKWDSHSGCMTGSLDESLTADTKKFRAAFNTWINDLAGFTETFKEYKD